jgi:octopine/nopaline transport system substrate-binding protein
VRPPPWDSIDANGQLVGYDIEVGKELCRRMNIESKFVAQDWEAVIPALTVGKYDAITARQAAKLAKATTMACRSVRGRGPKRIRNRRAGSNRYRSHSIRVTMRG